MENKNNSLNPLIIITPNEVVTKQVIGKITLNKIAELLQVSVDDIENIVEVGDIYNEHKDTPITMIETTARTVYTKDDEDGGEINDNVNNELSSIMDIDTNDKYFGTVVLVNSQILNIVA